MAGGGSRRTNVERIAAGYAVREGVPFVPPA